MKLVGPAVPGRGSAAGASTPIPALLPSFPGMHGVRDALEYGVKVTGCTVFLVDEGTDTGPVIAQAAVPVRDDDDEATLHERVKVAERALLVDTVGAMVREGWSVQGRKVKDRALTRVAIRRALISVYDKTGLDGLARALARGRGGDRLHRQHGGSDQRGRGAGDAGRGPDRLPRVPRRAGQDAAPPGACRAARRPGPARAP